MQWATELYEKIKRQKPLSSGNPTLDDLLQGGFLPHLSYYIHGSKYILNTILMNTAVSFFLAPVDGGKSGGKNGCDHKIGYVDGLNRFNPYYISKLAVSQKLGIQHVLKNILVSRVFTWNQMVEVLQEKIYRMENIDMILVAGLTNMMNEEEEQRESGAQYQDLKKIFDGLNRSIEKFNPTIIMTGPRDPRSTYKPLGGNMLRHFCNVINSPVIAISSSNSTLSYPTKPNDFGYLWK